MSLQDGTNHVYFAPEVGGPSSQRFAVESTKTPGDAKAANNPSRLFEIVSGMIDDEESDRAVGLGKLCTFLEKSNSGIDTSHGSNNTTALHVAAKNGLLDVAKALISFGASLSVTDSSGREPLHIACLEGNKEMADLFIKSGANIDARQSQGATPLHEACRNGHNHVVRLLVERGANVIVEDKDGWSPLSSAIQCGDAAAVRYLLQKDKSNIDTPEPTSGYTPLLAAITGGNEKFALTLIEMGAGCDIPDKDGSTALHLSISDGQLEVAFMLLQKKAKLNVKDKNGNTALHVAISKKGKDSHSGTDPGYNQAAVVRLLLEGGAKAEAENNNNETAIDLIMTNKEPTLFQVLLKHLCQPAFIDLFANLLKRDKFEEHLLQLIDRSSGNKETQETLDLALITLLDLVKSWNEQDLEVQRPLVLWSLFTASRPTPVLNLKLQSAFHPIDAMRAKHENQASTGNLYMIWDILRDPPFAQLHINDDNKFKKPVAEKRLLPILEKFEATIVQFYKDQRKSGALRRYRSVKEIIYGDGPTEIMRKAMKNVETLRTPYSVPLSQILSSERDLRFTWVHLPSKNMKWMDDLLTGMMKEKGLGAAQYFELKSFFQDSWTEVPDRGVPSRMMKPRALIRHTGDNPEPNLAAPVTPTSESLKASAVYMPYFSFSRLCIDDICTRRSQQHNKQESNGDQKMKDYRELLERYKDSPIHRSPTLDEWYYHFVEELEQLEGGDAEKDRIKRNTEQVVTKFLHPNAKENGKEGNASKVNTAQRVNKNVGDGELYDQEPWTLLRVNQIWIWTVASKESGIEWIISASSTSLDDTHDSLVEGVLDQLNKQAEYGGNKSQPESAKEMTKVIVDYCVGSYERKPKEDTKMSIGQIFSNYMNRIGREETRLFEIFCQRASNKKRAQKTTKDKNLTQKSSPDQDHGAISKAAPEEGTTENMKKSFERAERLFRDIKDVRDEFEYSQVRRSVPKDTNVSADYIENDIEGMENVADRIQSALNTTLSLQQSAISMSQNTVLMAFTLSTVVFLPLSFLSSLFALDVESFQRAPGWTFYVIFLGSLGVSLILWLGALYVEYIREVWGHLWSSVKSLAEPIPRPSENKDGKRPVEEATKTEDVEKVPEAIREEGARVSLQGPYCTKDCL